MISNERCIVNCDLFSVDCLFLFDIISNHKNRKSNDKTIEEIHKSNDLFDSLLKEIQANEKLTETVQRKTNAQDNFMWESILILANKIHDLEDNNYVK